MTVNELIAHLQKGVKDDPTRGDKLVVCSKDSEGNYFSPLTHNFEEGFYVPDTAYYGDFYDEEDLKSDVEDGFVDKNDAVACVVFWPVN